MKSVRHPPSSQTALWAFTHQHFTSCNCLNHAGNLNNKDGVRKMPIPRSRNRGMVWAVQSRSNGGSCFFIFKGIEIQGFVEASVSAKMFFWHFQALCSPCGCLLRNGMFEKANYLRFCSLSGIDQLPCVTSGWGFLSLAQIPLWNSPGAIKRGPQSKTGADDTGIVFSASLLTRWCISRIFL